MLVLRLNIFLRRLIYKMADSRQQLLYFLQIADFSHRIEFIFKAVIGQYNSRTIYSCTLIGENNGRISKEREKEWIKD